MNFLTIQWKFYVRLSEEVLLCDVTPSAPTLPQLLQTISLYSRWSTRGSDRGIALFFTATRNTIEGAGEKRTNEQNEQTSLGLTQVQKGSYVPLCICRLTLAWISSETSTKLLGMPTYPDRSSSLVLDSLMPTHLSDVRCRLVTPVTLRQLLLQDYFSNSLAGIPLPPSGHPRSRVHNPLSGFAPKQTKESSAWRTIYIVLQLILYYIFLKINKNDDGVKKGNRKNMSVPSFLSKDETTNNPAMQIVYKETVVSANMLNDFNSILVDRLIN